MAPVALVTGVSGQDGGYLAEQLLAGGWVVHGLVRTAVGSAALTASGVTLHEGDLARGDLFEHLVPAVRPDVVFHLAGESSVGRSWQDPATTADVTGAAVARLLQACFPHGDGGPRVVLAGSGEVFARTGTAPQDEGTPVAPGSPYGAAKAFALHLGRVYRDAGHHVGSAILYGHESPRRPRSFVTRKVTATVADIVRGRTDHLEVGNLDVVRDWGWAPDYVDALVRMAAQEQPGDYVVATGTGRSVRDFVAEAFSAVGVSDWERHVVVDPRLFRPVEGTRLVGDARLARESLGWRTTVGFEEVVSRMVAADLGQHAD